MIDTTCPHCWGLGEVIREDKTRNDKLFGWPCPLECAPGSAGLTRAPDLKKAQQRRVTLTIEPTPGKLMAHVLAEAGLFPSVGEAKRNGWNKPISSGVTKIGKREIEIEIA